MSYDFYAEVDTGGEAKHTIEPSFSDVHPAFSSDGMAGTAVATATGYARCGNYTSNVSPIWARCLTAALDAVPEARRWVGADAKAFNASGRTCHRLVDGEWQRNVQKPVCTDKLCLADLQGAPMADLVPLLKAAVEWGVEHIDELRELDPDNGWGNAEGAVTYLWDIQRFCGMHPNATLYLSH